MKLSDNWEQFESMFDRWYDESKDEDNNGNENEIIK